MEGYETAVVKGLKKVKSLLLTRVNKIYRRYGDHHHPILVEFKSLVRIARDLIRQYYVNEVNFQWREKLTGYFTKRFRFHVHKDKYVIPEEVRSNSAEN